MSTKSSVRLVFCSLAAIVCMSVASPGVAAIDMFLKIPGIAGNSRHETDGIDVGGYAFDVKSPRDSSSGLATGKRQHKPMSLGTEIGFTKYLDKASPQLMKVCIDGQTVEQAVLHCRKSGGDDDYLKITMKECIISSFQTSGDPSDDSSVESFSISFAHVDIDFIFPPTQPGSAPTVITLSYDSSPSKKKK